MAQGDIVNFYKTKNIKTTVENSKVPDKGSFIHDTSNDGFYIVETDAKDAKELRRLNASLPVVEVTYITGAETAPWGTCEGVIVREGTTVLLNNHNMYDAITIKKLELNGTVYNARFSEGVRLKPNVAQLVVFTKNSKTWEYEFYAISAASDEAKDQLTIINTDVTVDTSWSGNSENGYTKYVTVDDILAGDTPIIDVLLDYKTAAENRNALTSYQCISKIEVTTHKTLQLTALNTKPTSEFKLKIKIIRN